MLYTWQVPTAVRIAAGMQHSVLATDAELWMVELANEGEAPRRLRVNGEARISLDYKLMAEFPGVEILIHPDPEGLVDEDMMGAENLLSPGPDGTSPAILAQGAPNT